MSAHRIVIGMLDLRLLGARLRELWPLEDNRDFDHLLQAIDAHDLGRSR